jgi:regulator of RNase E activity RraA
VKANCVLFPRAADLPEEAAGLADLPTSIISDSMDRFGGAAGIGPMPAHRPRRLFGQALTVRTRPGDNLVIHKAIELARPGDVIVVDAGGHIDRAVMGEIMCRRALRRGAAGYVVDGAIRDVAEIEELGFPVYARGVSHVGPYKSGPGEIGGPVAIGGQVVRSGDAVVGDADGVVFIHPERVAEVLASGTAILEKEKRMIEAVMGEGDDRSWIDESLNIIEAVSRP